MVVGALLVGGADAAEPSLESGLADCATRRDDSVRLACFDAVVGRLGLGGQATVADREAAFGGEFLQRDEPLEPERGVSSITASIEQLERRPRGERVFHLDNGQVWTELETGRSQYRQGMNVTVERTPSGSYMMSTDTGRATRVRRMQ
jgi:hypothetical protein